MRPSILTSAVVAALLPALPLSAAASAESPAPAVAARAKAKGKKKPRKPAKRPAARRRAPARRRAAARRRAPAPAGERIPRDPPKPGVVYSVSGTVTVTAVIRTRCSGLGDKGWIVETVSTISEHSFSGSGAPGGLGTLTTRMRRRAVQDKQVIDVEYVKPLHLEGEWTSSSSDTRFGDVVFLSRGELFVDLEPAIGERRRSRTVRPAPGASAPVRFGGTPVRVETPDPGVGCVESYSTTEVTGTVDVANR